MRYLGLNEFTEGLSQSLAQDSLKKSYAGKAALLQELKGRIEAFLQRSVLPLDLSYRVWDTVAENGEGMQPVTLFGAEFIPDLVIQVGGQPTVALRVELVGRSTDATVKLSEALGHALVYSLVYPAVILVLYQKGRRLDHGHLFDREIRLDLWRRHKVLVMLL